MSSAETEGLLERSQPVRRRSSWASRSSWRCWNSLGVVVAPVLDGQGGILAGFAQLAHDVARGGGGRALVHAHARGSLVDQVDGLIGQEAVGDIAGGKFGGGLEGFVGDRQAVVLLVRVLMPLRISIVSSMRGLIDHDRLEAAFERRVAFDVLAVFVQGGGADDLQLAARKRGLEDVRGVDRRTGRAGADEHVHLVDEEDRAGGLQFVDDPFEAFFKLAAVHRAGDQRADIELQDALAQQQGGHFAFDDALRQPFDDGGLAHAGLADEGRVVLRAAGQDLDDAFDLHLASDDRVEFAFLGLGGQVDGQLVHQGGLGLVFIFFLLASAPDGFGCRRRGLGGGLSGRRVGAGLLQDAAGLAADLLGGDAQLAQHFHPQPIGGAHQAEQKVFGADVVVPHAAGLVDGVLEHLLGARGKVDLTAAVLAEAAQAFDHLADAIGFQAQFAQYAPGDAAVFLDQAEQ